MYLIEGRNMRTYVGYTLADDPFYRLSQHNGERPGGVARLRGGRPWRVAAWVRGFPSCSHALKFERAWQHGLAAPCMRDVSHFRPSRGVTGKLEVLHALLHTRAWYAHALCVCLARPQGSDACSAARDATRVAALDYSYVERV